MLEDLDNAIRGVIDVDLYNSEVAREKDDLAYLTDARTKAVKALKNLIK